MNTTFSKLFTNAEIRHGLSYLIF